MAEELIDFKAQADRVSSAIRGAKAALDLATTDEERDQFTNDLVLLAQAKNNLEKKYAQQQEKTQAELEAGQKEARQELASGAFVVQQARPLQEYISSASAPFYQPPVQNKEQTRRNLIETTSRAFNVAPEKIDIDSGLSAKERFALSILPTDSDKIQLLREKYGTVIPMVVQGRSEVFVQKGDKLVKANEVGDSWGDIAAFGGSAAREPLPTAGAIGAGIAGYPSVAGSAALSTTAYGTISGVQDIVIRKTYGLDAQPVEVLTRQGMNAVVSFPIDVATAGTSKFLARRMGRPVVNELDRNLTNAKNTLLRAGIDVEVPSGAKFGPFAIEAQKILAQMYPGKKNATRLNKNMEQLGNLVQSWTGAGNPERISKATLDRLRQQRKTLIDDIAGKDERVKRMLTQHYDRQLERLQIPEFQKQPAGRMLSGIMQKGELEAIEINKKSFRGYYDTMDAKGVEVPFDDAKRQILNLLIKAKKEGFKTVDDSGIYSVIDKIDQQKRNFQEAKILRGKIEAGDLELTPQVQDDLNRLSASGSSLTFEDIASIKQQLAAAVPEGGAAGKGNPAKNLASKISEEFNKYVDDLAEKNGMLDEWKRVNAAHREDRLLFERSSPGAILKEVLGDSKLSPSQIVDTAIADPRNAEDVLRAVSFAVDESGSSMEPLIRSELQKAYLSQIGLTSKAGIAPKTIDFNPEMIDVLWGPSKGKLLSQRIGKLNEAFRIKGIKPDNLSSDDIGMLSNVMGEEQTQKLISTIAQKKAMEQEAQKLADDKIIQLALKKEWSKLTNGELAASAISPNVPSDSVSKIFRSMPLEERKAFSADFLYELLATYSATGKPLVKAPFIKMPDAEKFLTDIGQTTGQAATQEGRELLRKMRITLGPEMTDRFIAAQKMVAASQASGQKIDKGELRTVIGVGGVSAYLSEGLSSFAHNRIMSAAFASDGLRPFLDILARDAGSAATEKAYSRMLSRLLTTQAGISALTDQMGNDPAFAEAMSKMTSDLKQSEEESKLEIDKR